MISELIKENTKSTSLLSVSEFDIIVSLTTLRTDFTVRKTSFQVQKDLFFLLNLNGQIPCEDYIPKIAASSLESN